MKRSMSMLCSLVHGDNKQQPTVKAAMDENVPPSSVAPEVPPSPEPAPLPVAEVVVPPTPTPRQEEPGPKFGQAYIKVVGCGGGGGNAIARMISAGLQVRL